MESSRLEASRNILFEDLTRRNHPGTTILRNHPVNLYESIEIIAPIYVERSNGAAAIIDVSGAMTAGVPADPKLAEYIDIQSSIDILLVEELMVRRESSRGFDEHWKGLKL